MRHEGADPIFWETIDERPSTPMMTDMELGERVQKPTSLGRTFLNNGWLWRGAKGRLAIGAFLILAVAGAFVTGLYWNGRTASQATATTATQDTPADPGLSTTTSDLPVDTQVGSNTQGNADTVTVDVHGDVRHPGVYRLSSTARVEDAVRAAGGFVHMEDSELVNAAAPLDDGVEVVIPNAVIDNASGVPRSRQAAQGSQGSQPSQDSRGSNGTPDVQLSQASSQSSQPPTGTENYGAQLFSSGGAGENLSANQASTVVRSVPAQAKLDLNTSSEAALESLPGIGPGRASAIIQYREAHGRFHSVAELQQVHGIGPKTFAKLAPYLMVQGQP